MIVIKKCWKFHLFFSFHHWNMNVYFLFLKSVSIPGPPCSMEACTLWGAYTSTWKYFCYQKFSPSPNNDIGHFTTFPYLPYIHISLLIEYHVLASIIRPIGNLTWLLFNLYNHNLLQDSVSKPWISLQHSWLAIY